MDAETGRTPWAEVVSEVGRLAKQVTGMADELGRVAEAVRGLEAMKAEHEAGAAGDKRGGDGAGKL